MAKFWCERKGKWISERKAQKKCINRNIKKRGLRCLSLMTEDEARLFSAKLYKDFDGVGIA